MDVAALRTWGLAASSAAFSVALTVALLSGCQQEAARTAPSAAKTPPPAAATTSPAPSAEAPAASEGGLIAEPASDATPPPAPAASNARPSFLIRFEAPHPIARAHRLAERSRMPAARAAVLAGLRQRRDLDGLCFDSFTVGGAEVVLRACSDVPDPAAFERRWVRRLQRMNGVDYAEANSVAQTEGQRR